MKNVSSFHQFILEMQQILEPPDLKATSIFDQHNAKVINLTLKFPEFLSTNQKSAYSIDSFLRNIQFQCLETRIATTIFDPIHGNIFQSAFNFYESASICKKSGFFIILF